MPIRTEAEIDNAIARYTRIRDTLRAKNLEAHAAIADHAISALMWVRCEQSVFTDILKYADALKSMEHARLN